MLKKKPKQKLFHVQKDLSKRRGTRFLFLPTFFFKWKLLYQFFKVKNLKDYLKLGESDEELWKFKFCVGLHLIFLQKPFHCFYTFSFQNMYSVILCWAVGRKFFYFCNKEKTNSEQDERVATTGLSSTVLVSKLT